MGWCHDHLGACIFAGDDSLRGDHCPQESGGECTLVHIMLAVHRMPEDIRRRLIAALYPAYGIPPGSEPSPSPPKPAPPRKSGHDH